MAIINSKRWVRYPIEALLLVVFLGFFRFLPVNAASALGGCLGRSIGPRLGATRRAHRNLRLVFPEKSESERDEIVHEMWDNLGRMAAEFSHLGELSRRNEMHIEFVGAEQIVQMAANRAPAILVGAHIANWELMSVYLSSAGLELTSVARGMNNKISEPVIEYCRNRYGGSRIDKSKIGARKAVATLRRGGMLGILIDQKYNNGILSRLMGHDAMTAAGPAQLSIQFDCPIIPVRIERIRDTHFRISCSPAIEFARTGNKDTDVKALTQLLNNLLENWIRERPGQWFWLHRRWSEKAYKSVVGRPEARTLPIP